MTGKMEKVTSDKVRDHGEGIAGKGSASPQAESGEYFKFGKYPQNNDGIKEPIEWLVLEVKDNEALLVSRYGLDCKQHCRYFTNLTWEDSELREWLNKDFLKAFSRKERQRIILSDVVNDDNPRYHTKGGNNTRDRVFCLSLAEAERYLKDNGARLCQPTKYAHEQGALPVDDNGCCSWWLRSPGIFQEGALNVSWEGEISLYGIPVYTNWLVVRPALRIIWDL